MTMTSGSRPARRYSAQYSAVQNRLFFKDGLRQLESRKLSADDVELVLDLFDVVPYKSFVNPYETQAPSILSRFSSRLQTVT